MKIYKSVTEIAGNTPLLELRTGTPARVLAKLESLNPAGSAKDRAARQMLTGSMERGAITRETLIIEPTSGNTGIALAADCAAMGLKCIIVMPENMSIERQRLMRAYGAEVVLTPASEGISGSIAKAQELAEGKNAFIPNQFSNHDNFLAHYHTTGPEIWRDTEGTVDIFISGVGTGGTVSGTGKFLKEQNPSIRVIAAEPASSPVLSGGKKGAHKIQGIGAGFVPEVFDRTVVDEIITVRDEEAFTVCRWLSRYEGVLAGISSGAALAAALKVAARSENAGKTAVVMFPDSGERYLSCMEY